MRGGEAFFSFRLGITSLFGSLQLTCQPLDTIKVRMQLSRSGSMPGVRPVIPHFLAHATYHASPRRNHGDSSQQERTSPSAKPRSRCTRASAQSSLASSPKWRSVSRVLRRTRSTWRTQVPGIQAWGTSFLVRLLFSLCATSEVLSGVIQRVLARGRRKPLQLSLPWRL